MTDRSRPSRWSSRAVVWLVMTPRPAWHRTLALVGASVSIALIGLLDAATGRDLSFAVFYLLPVAAATILVSSRAGYVFAVVCAAAWVFADTVIYDQRGVLDSLFHGVLRALTVSVVVFLLGALRSALIEAAESRQRTEEFLATAAHQLRTPIAGVMASAEALAVEVDPDRRERLTHNLVESSERIGRLLTALLRLSRIDRVPATEQHGAADLAAVCRAEIEAAGIRFPEVHFECDAPNSVHLPISLPAIGEALGNLLENAGRHAVGRVLLDLRVEHDQVTIEVSDDGPGVPAGMEERVFERFVTMDGLGGSGLGLPIARGLIESQDGELHYTGSAHFRATLRTSRRMTERGEPAARPQSKRRRGNDAHRGERPDEQRVLQERGRWMVPYPTRSPRGPELQ